MSDTDSQNASGGASMWNIILSSSIALAAITGVFYFAGGAKYQGSVRALGLNYLSGLQPNDYLFAGVKLYTWCFAVIFRFANAGVSGRLPQRNRPKIARVCDQRYRK